MARRPPTQGTDFMTSALATIHGNITGDPELRYTQNGVAVAGFSVAHSPRIFDRNTNEWKDSGEPLFLRVNVWRDQAENVANSIRKGDAVIVIGRLESRSWQDKEGNTRTSVELSADVVSVDLRRQRVEKVQRMRREPAGEPAAESWAPSEPAPLRSDAKASAAA